MRAGLGSTVKADLGNREISLEGAADCDQAQPPQPFQIQSSIQPVGREIRKRQIDGLPIRTGDERRAVGLPRTEIISGPKVNIVALAIAANQQPDAVVGASVDIAAAGLKIQGRLDKATVILKPNIACQMKSVPAIKNGKIEMALGNASHHLIADGAPFRTEFRRQNLVRKIVDQHILASCFGPDARDEDDENEE